MRLSRACLPTDSVTDSPDVNPRCRGERAHSHDSDCSYIGNLSLSSFTLSMHSSRRVPPMFPLRERESCPPFCHHIVNHSPKSSPNSPPGLRIFQNADDPRETLPEGTHPLSVVSMPMPIYPLRAPKKPRKRKK